MRKVTLLTAVLLCFGLVGAFGQAVDFSFEAEASATFGVDLDEQATGFSNDAEFTASWTLVEEATEEKGEGDVYGWIELDGFAVEFDKTMPDDATIPGTGASTLDGDNDYGLTVTAPDISAKVFLGPAYIDITSHDAEVDMASQFSEIEAEIVPFGLNAILDLLTEDAGVAVGFEAGGIATVELGLVSESDWILDSDTAPAGVGDEDQAVFNDDNAYAMTLYTELTPIEMLTVEVMSSAWFGRGGGNLLETTDAGDTNPAAVGVAASYDLEMSSDLTLTPEFGADVIFQQSDDVNNDHELLTAFEVSAGANLLWPGLGVEDEDVDIFGLDDREVTSGVGFGLTYTSDPFYDAANQDVLRGNAMGVKLGFYEDSGDDGLLPVVGGSVVVNYNNYLKNSDLVLTQYELGLSQFGLGVELNATVGPAMPYIGFITGDTDMDDNYVTADPGFTLNVGTDLNVISNTTFNIDYVSADLTNEADSPSASVSDVYYEVSSGVDSVGNDPTVPKLGRLEISTTIEY